MARPKRVLNEAKSAVIQDEILKENPDGFSDEQPIQVVRELPKMETIIFRNDRDPGVALEFHYHSKTHYLHRYKLLHDHEYTLPVEIIEHLEDRKIPIYAYRKGADGHPEMYVTGYRHLFTCKPVRNRHAA